jgi:uncharacterized surface protein with fasciclin (FAS1) repeats
MKWRIARIASAVALILVAIPYAVTAQNAIVSSTVSGQLNEQFAKHYLGLQVIDPMQPVEINMAYDPQDSLPLDQNAGLYVFDAGNFKRYTNGVPASETASQSSDLKTVDGIKRKTIDYGASVASSIVTLVVYNDSTASLSYTLTGTNVRFVDDSGTQVVAGSTPAPAATPTPASTSAPAAAAPAPAATATQAAPAPTAMAAGVKSTRVRGTLSEQFAKHYLGLEVIDTGMPVTIKMAYDPQDSPTLDADSGFYVFTESGFNQYTSAVPPSQSAHQTSHQETTDGVKQKAAEITSENASKIVTLVTYNDTTTTISYTLTGTNVKFIDESGTQVEGDRMAAPAPAAQPTAAAATPGAGTLAAATPVPAGTDITPGTTYTVQTGDTLGTISSRAYGSNAHWSAICNANSLADCDHIEVGAVLNIPTLAQTGVQQPGATATPAATADAMTPEPKADAMTPEPTSEAMPEPTAEASPGVGNIVEVAEDYEDLDILLLALDLAGLSSTISDGGPYTIFAPTNAAFASLPETRLDTLMADSALLAETLRYHVVSGTLTSSDLASQTSLTTLEGSTISITSENGTLKVEGVSIVTSDVTASNGVIHFINELLPEPEADSN